MPDYEQAALDSFIAELNRVWRMAGPPSYAELERLSRQAQGTVHASGLRVESLAASTTHEILTGQRSRPPRWQWVASFLTVLRIAAAEGGVNPDSLGPLGEWKNKHEAACAALRSTSQLTRVTGHHGPAASGPQQAWATGSQPAWEAEASSRGAVWDNDLPAETFGPARPASAWWHEYRDVVPGWFERYLTMESAANVIRTYETTAVPGLLQTAQYAAAVMRLDPESANEHTIDRRVELRMRRQQVLTRPEAPRLWAIIDEAALRSRLGDAETMRNQIKHLIRMSEQPNISIQLVPLDSGIHAASSGPITVFRFPDRDVPDVVYLEQLTSALYLYRQNDVDHYGKVLGSLGIEAISPSGTAAVLHEILLQA